MNIKDYEIFKFADNSYTDYENNGRKYLLNKEVYLDIVLTDYCNSNCNFCIADLIHNKLNCNLEIFKEKIKFAVDNLHVREVLLLGGEPTMSKNLLEIVHYLNTLNLDKIVMTSNGIRLAQNKEYRESILSSGITNLNISFMNLNPSKQVKVTNSKYILQLDDIANIYNTCVKYGVKMRINNNIFLNNNDKLEDIIEFYEIVSPYCDSIKFSPLLETDSFSVVDYKTEWARTNRLSDNKVYKLFISLQKYYIIKHKLSIIENDLQFGFVKNTMIPLNVPIILNWNFGNYTGMMSKAKEGKINNLKLLPNNELSLSWNRELSKYFIKTN